MLTESEFKIRLKDKNPTVTLLGHYLGMHKKTLFKCNECGNEWLAAPYHIIGGRGCKKCGHKKTANALTLTNDEFISRLKVLHPTIEPLEEYAGSNTKIKCKCKKCGAIWATKPHGLLGKNKNGCPKCAIKKLSDLFSKTNEQFIKEFKEKTKDIIVLGNYINSKTKIKFKCKRCNYEWYATPNSMLKKASCPSCSKSGTSYVEQFILLSLRKILGKANVLSRKKEVISKELDIYLPDYKIAIEYGSWYWHKNRIKGDNEKYKLCKNKEIELIRIYDYCKNECRDTKDVWYYNVYLGDRIEDLLSLVKRILGRIKVKYDYNELKESAKEISELAQLKSLKMGENDFLERVKVLNPDIEINSSFLGRKSKVKCRCKICNNIWESTPQSLLSGRGCKLCGYKKTAKKINKDHEWFLENFKQKNKDAKSIIFLTNYKRSTDKIKCKCLKCDNIWHATPHMLLQDHGCPKCAKSIKSNERFLSELKQKNSHFKNIEILTEYKGVNEPIKFKCKLCNRIQTTKASSLLSGSGCKNCSHSKMSNDEFINRLKKTNKKYKEIKLLEQYKTMRTKIKCKCLKCNNIWMADPNRLLNGCGCPNCYGTKKKTHKEFVEELKQNNQYYKNIVFLSKYETARKKIKWKCRKCNSVMETRPSQLINGSKCPHCHFK